MARRRRKGKRWALGTVRGILRNEPMTERVHPRRRYGDNRVPWRRHRQQWVRA